MAFHLARHAREGNITNLQRWIDYGVSIDAANVRNETALFISSLRGHVKCVEFLLSHGADPNKSSIVGMTPLHAAIQNDHIKCVGLLLQYGSDLHCTFAEYPTVVAFARYHGNAEILRLLHAFMVDRGLGHHQPAQNYNAIILSTCASASCVKLAEENNESDACGIPIITLKDIKKPEHKHSFSTSFFAYIDGMWKGSLVTVKHAPQFSDDEFYRLKLRKEINLLRQLRHFRFPVAMAICLEPFCLIMERFYHSSLSIYLRDPNMDMEKHLECHLSRVIRLMLDVAQALSYLHRKNWVHCHVSSQSILVSDGPRAKLGSLEFCERPGAAVDSLECFQDELPWLAPELLAVGEACFPADIYSLAVSFWECLTRHTPWSWLPELNIPASRQLPILFCWPSLVKRLLGQCLDEEETRPTADTVCRKLAEFMRLNIWLDRYQLDDMFKDWLTEYHRNAKTTSISISSSCNDIVSLALEKKRSSVSENNSTPSDTYKERINPHFRRRSAVVTTLVEEALAGLTQIGRPPTDVHEADIYKFGIKLAREIADLRGICSVAIKKQRKTWAKVAMATRDLEEDMFDSLAGYEEVTFRRKHAHALNLKKHHQEQEEEKLKECLDRKRALIKRHKRKNWACYTMLLCELYGILRRRDRIADSEDGDYETEALVQSIDRLSSQMTKLNSIMFEYADANASFNPITVLTQNNSDNVRGTVESTKDPDNTSADSNQTASDSEPTMNVLDRVPVITDFSTTYLEQATTSPDSEPEYPDHEPEDVDIVAKNIENVPLAPIYTRTSPVDTAKNTDYAACNASEATAESDVTPSYCEIETTDFEKHPRSMDGVETPTGSQTVASVSDMWVSDDVFMTSEASTSRDLAKRSGFSRPLSCRVRSLFKKKKKNEAKYMESSL